MPVVDLAVLVPFLCLLGRLTGDDKVLGEEVVVILPSPDLVVGDRVEGPAEDFGVAAGGATPQVDEVGRKRVSDEAVRRGVPVVMIDRVVGDRRPVDVRTVGMLVGNETEVLAVEEAAEGGGKLGSCVRAAIHISSDRRRVLDDDGNFGVVVAELRAVVEVGRTADDQLVVSDEDLGVDVKLLRDKGIELILGATSPWNAEDGQAALHVAGRDGVPALVGQGSRGRLVATVVAIVPARV